jgi:hypothetical protein
MGRPHHRFFGRFSGVQRHAIERRRQLFATNGVEGVFAMDMVWQRAGDIGFHRLENLLKGW